MMLYRVEDLSLKQLVADKVKNAILSGGIKPGEKIAEEKISEALGISRTPLREAINLLVNYGLVDVVPRRGAFVSHITAEEIIYILMVRLALEPLGIELATKKMIRYERFIDGLTELLEEFNGKKVGQGAEADIAFHRLIVESSGNATLLSVMLPLFYRSILGMADALLVPGDRWEWVADHQKIVDALAVRDSGVARIAMIEHLTRVMSKVKKGFKEA